MQTKLKTALLASAVAFFPVAQLTFLAAPAHAQVTTSSVNGVVTDSNGNTVSDASVQIVYVPTGLRRTATTSANGVFFFGGLPVGGPYNISVETAEGSDVQTGVRLQPSSNALNFRLTTMDEVVATGVVQKQQDLNNGVGTSFSSNDILTQPSTERDLISTLLRDPLTSSTGEGILSVAGTNPRFNALAIDGSLQQDDFGLSSSTYPTARAPISLDVVESASVAASDYSVTSSGFTGGLVNVVTKSGTNEIDGALFYYKQNEDFYGTNAFDREVERAEFDEEEYGFTVSGPIIKDKLFFLASYDKFESGSSANFTQGDIDNDTNPAIYAGINDIVQDTYGFDLGGRPDTVSLPILSERILAKLDWNINDQHRASFTYQDTVEDGTSGVGRTSFQSAYYQTPTDLKAYTGQLFSNWTDNFSTNLRYNYKDYSRAQACLAGDGVGAWDIRLSEADLVGTTLEGFLDDGDANPAETANTLFLTGGCDRFRQGNTFADERTQIYGEANYVAGDHVLTFGGEFQNYKLDNLFAQRSVGLFQYESIADLEAGFADSVQVQLPDSGVREDIRAVWGYDTLAFFIQDSWQARSDLRLDFGLRYERILQDDQPDERTFFQDAYGVRNDVNLDGNDLVMPRFSFNYRPFERTTITGGFGLYGGGDPKVWTSNAFTPPVFFERISDVAGTNPANGTPPALLAAIQENSANDPGPIDVIGSNFRTPSDWKASLRWDQEFDIDFLDGINMGDGYRLSLQALYSKSKDGFRWENLAQTQLDETSPLGVAPDGRPIYADLDDLRLNNAIALVNSEGDESITLSASLSNQFDNGFGFFTSYAYQDVESVTPGSSSRGVSNFRAIVDTDRNNPGAATSPYQIEHSFKLGLNYEREIVPGLLSEFNLFGQMFSGDAFSYTFDVANNNSLFGRSGDFENPFDNDLLYVPAISGGVINDPNVVLASSFQADEFIDFVGARGLTQGIQERNAGRSTWNQRFDFQYQQEIPFFNEKAAQFVGDNKLKFVLDIKNIGNLLNDEWGTQFNGPGFDTLNIVRSDLVSAADVAANGVDGAAALTGDAARTTCVSATSCQYRLTDFDNDPSSFRSLTRSVYEIRAGIRYEF